MERDTTSLEARKEPRQERSRRLVSAVLEAARRILREQGLDALTTPHLCEVAGVSPGSLYQYFPSKDAVLYALLREHAEEVTTALTEVLLAHRDAPPERLVAAAVEAFLATHRRDPVLHSTLGRVVASRAGPGLEDDLLRRGEAALSMLLQERRDALPDRDLAVTSFLLLRTLEGVVHAASRDAPHLLDDPSFADGLRDMLLAIVRR